MEHVYNESQVAIYHGWPIFLNKKSGMFYYHKRQGSSMVAVNEQFDTMAAVKADIDKYYRILMRGGMKAIVINRPLTSDIAEPKNVTVTTLATEVGSPVCYFSGKDRLGSYRANVVYQDTPANRKVLGQITSLDKTAKVHADRRTALMQKLTTFDATARKILADEAEKEKKATERRKALKKKLKSKSK